MQQFLLYNLSFMLITQGNKSTPKILSKHTTYFQTAPSDTFTYQQNFLIPHIKSTATLLLQTYINDRCMCTFKHFSPVLFPQPIPLDSTTLRGRPIIRGSLPSLVCRCCRPRICCCPSPCVTYCGVSAGFCTTAAR